jgi:hypothetical protein
MEIEVLVARYPRLWHMAEEGSWEGIQKHGLLSTSALLDLFEIEGERRFAIESSWRPEIVRIEHPEHGSAFVRDQKPMPESVLSRCLVGMTVQQWYEALNRRVFFWAEAERLRRFLRAYGEGPRIVLEVDTAGLLERHADLVALSRINSGAPFGGNPAPRGAGTFRSIAGFPPRERIAELTVDYAVRDVTDFVLSVSRWRGDERLRDDW